MGTAVWRHCLVTCALAGLVAVAGAFAHAESGRSSDGEMVVIPYSCVTIGGRPVLTPSDNRGHRVLGRRQTTNHTACAADDPTLCRRWTVHRFDMDCGGRPVAWTDVVAASTTSDQAWVEDGAFHIRMPVGWGRARHDPCFSPAARQQQWRPGLWRHCAERRARGEHQSGATVALPVGYAPTFGMDAIFVAGQTAAIPPSGPPSRSSAVPQGGARVEGGEPPLRWVESPRVEGRPSDGRSLDGRPGGGDGDRADGERVAGERGSRTSDGRIASLLLPPAERAPTTTGATGTASTNTGATGTGRGPLAEATKSAPPTTSPVTAPPPGVKPAPTSRTPATAVAMAPLPPVPTPVPALTEPTAPAPIPAPTSTGSTTSPPPSVVRLPEVAAAQRSPVTPRILNAGEALVTNGAISPPAPSSAVRARATPPAADATTAALDPDMPRTLGFGAGLPTAVTADASARAEGQTRAAAGAGTSSAGDALPEASGTSPAGTSPDLAPTVTTEVMAVGVAGTLAVMGLALLAVAMRRSRGGGDDQPPERDLGAIRMHREGGDERRGGMPSLHTGGANGAANVPRTPDEAMEVLGLGPSPDADIIAIKKLVDALRFNWHPDRAGDAADRDLRETRLQQINAAWDILQARK